MEIFHFMDFCFLNLFIGGTTIHYCLGFLQSCGGFRSHSIKSTIYRQATKLNIDRNI